MLLLCQQLKQSILLQQKPSRKLFGFKGLITELGFEQKHITVFCDSQSVICLSKNQIHHERTKHIDIKLHFIRLEVSKGVVKLLKIHTNDNLADMLTKPVPGAKFEFCLSSTGISRV